MTWNKFFLPEKPHRRHASYQSINTDDDLFEDEEKEKRIPPITFDGGIGVFRCWSAFLNIEKLLYPMLGKGKV